MKFALTLLCLTAAAQTPQTFEAADVHVSPAGASQSAGFLPGGRVEFHATTMLRLISQAWSIPPQRITGGPNWIDTDRFDLVAKAPGPASQIIMNSMMQNLLVERFELTVNQGDKPMPVFVMMPGKGNPPKESSGSAEPSCQRTVEDGVLTMKCRNTTFSTFAESLPGVAPGYFNRPVVDQSGLKGAYDFTLTWVGRGQLQPGSEGNSQSLFTVIEKQFGVKIEQQTAPMPVLEITKVNRTPTPNLPNVTEKLGPPPTEFDVVEIHMSAPGTKEDFDVSNGRVRATGISLHDFIGFAYNVEDDGVKGGEKWLTSERFDITAKTAPTASEDVLRTMLKSMLIERLGLKTHSDLQPLSILGLTAVKPKFKEADPRGRSTCQMNRADGGREFVCTNVTMAQFAERLPAVAVGYIEHPVVDLTGMKGSYDFVVSWSPLRQTNRPNASAEATANGPVPTAQVPTGITLFEALERQLGLKLSSQKHPMPVVVIDHVERKPTAN